MKKNIAVVSGGNSSEFGISIQSGEQIANWIDKSLFNVYEVIFKGTKWLVKSSDSDEIIVNKDDFSFTNDGEKINFDCALIIIHGDPGENGKLQGYFDTLGIPYTTAGVLASSLTFDKIFSKNYLKGFGIETANFLVYKKGEEINIDEIINYVGLPCFIKPSKGGSSYGVSKVKSEDEIENAIQIALQEDEDVLIEKFIDGRELTCGILKTTENTYIFPPTEIISKNEFFDYEAKYEGASEEITPAEISKEITKEIQNLTLKIYELFNLRGFVRIDYLFAEDTLYFMEANTVPGMSGASIVPQQVEAAGLNMKDLLTELIEDSI